MSTIVPEITGSFSPSSVTYLKLVSEAFVENSTATGDLGAFRVDAGQIVILTCVSKYWVTFGDHSSWHRLTIVLANDDGSPRECYFNRYLNEFYTMDWQRSQPGGPEDAMAWAQYGVKMWRRTYEHVTTPFTLTITQ